MTVALLGFAWDNNSSYARGPALAPLTIRSVLFSDAFSGYSLSGVNVREAIAGFECPELPNDAADCRDLITAEVSRAITADHKPLSLGGDHSVTYPILRAIKKQYGPVNLLHIDAHPDSYDVFENDRYSHACPFARAMEAGCIGNLVQVGVRSIAPEHRLFAQKHAVDMLTPDQVDEIPYAKLIAPLYVSIDMDGFDPAFAPGVSHPEPGGLSSREVLKILSKLNTPLVGADIVELNPERDMNLATANLAARLVKELVAMLV